MIQAREKLRLALEARSPLFTLKELFRQDLQRDRSADAGVPRPVYLPHPACPEERQDFVRAKPRAGLERQADEGV